VLIVTVQEHFSSGVPGRPARAVEVYDFSRPTTLARDHARVLELAFETFARQWGTQLTAQVRVVSQVTCEQVLMCGYDEYAASLPATTTMVLCPVEGLDAKAVVQFPSSAALYCVSHMLGGTGRPQAPERPFTQIEQALVRRLMDDALEDLHYSFGGLLTRSVTVGTIEYNSQFAQAAATADLMIVASFVIKVGDKTAAATLAVPAEALLPQLGAPGPVPSPTPPVDLLRAQLGWVPVDVSLRLAHAGVLPSAILALAVGDVLPIPHPTHRPLDVVVDGRALARAAVGSTGSRLACIIIDTEEKTP
jgi:flagellar motor switch protein FliM